MEEKTIKNKSNRLASILITGGTGFVGTKLSKALLERGNHVVLFDILDPPKEDKEGGKATYVKGNISNFAEVYNAVRDWKIEHIFHLGGMLVPQCEANPWAAFQTNGLGTYYILEASRLFGVKKVIFPSTLGVYENVPDGIAYDDTIQRPHSMYGVLKAFSELLGLYYHRRFGIDFRGVRFPNLVGPGTRTQGSGQYTAKIIESAIRGIPFEPWVAKETSIPMMYVKDAIRSLLELFDADESKIKTRIYNIGQISPLLTAGDLLEEVKKHFPQVSITFKPDLKLLENINAIPKQLSDEKARAEWGWSVRYGLKEMVEDFIKEFNPS
jgi:threonine 3-dehydrogenase